MTFLFVKETTGTTAYPAGCRPGWDVRKYQYPANFSPSLVSSSPISLQAKEELTKPGEGICLFVSHICASDQTC